jgi:formamidopyrimidine-DNA glycosylase
MPELPEVETVKRGLSKLIVNKEITKVDFDNQKSFPNNPNDVNKFLIGSKILAIRRRAKVLLIDLSSEYTLMIHLRMTGQLVFVGQKQQQLNTKKQIRNKSEKFKFESSSIDQFFKFKDSNFKLAESGELRFGAGHPNDSLINKLPDKSTRVSFKFSDGSHLYFNDQRKFGWVKLIPTELISEDPFIKKVGPEPLEASFTGKILFERLQKRKGTSIKAALLDQTVLAGIGNIYADEGLWQAGIHPAKKVSKVDYKNVEKLHKALVDILQLSIEKGGSTDRNYVNAEGKKGSYIDFARVFRREGLQCYKCGTIIEKSRVAGRGTHVCLSCQPLN